MSWISRSEKKNYNCIMEIMNVPVCEGLREIFKQEWDKHYGAAKGVWDDTSKSGNELYNMEKSRPHAKQYVKLYQSGKRSEWDISALSDAILYSNAIKKHLSPHVFDKVNVLRELRNKLIHVDGSQHEISESELNNAYKKIHSCFKVLKLPTKNVDEILNSSKRKFFISFGKMTYICLGLFFAGLLFSASYHWYTNPITAKSLTSFRILPVRPLHLVANRSRTVNAILEELHNLRIRNNRSLTYFYISGNPGSGKSQLARLIGQQYGFNNSLKDSSPDSIVFVMTLKARSVQDILQSYADFARRVDCHDSIITNIINSSQTNTEWKIQSLKTEIAKILKNVNKEYTWLLIIDNVVKLKEIYSFLPQLENEDWQDCQMLITTQDMSSVPPNSSLTVHISVSQGMDPVESCQFLTNLSGIVTDQELVGKVAKELDYQPLALASAAFYVKQLRETKASSYFNWRDYLNKLNEGKRNLTEMKLSEVNKPAYSLTMSTAVLLAVKSFAESDPVLKHAFTFFSFASYEAQALDVVVSYILRADKEKEKDEARLTVVQCSLILVSDDQKVVSVLMHRVVHDSIKHYVASYKKKNTKSRVPLNILQILLEQKCALGEIALIPHLKAFYARTKNLSSTNIVPRSMKSKQRMQKQIFDLTSALSKHGEFLLSKNYLIFALKIAKRDDENKIELKGSRHVSFPKIGEIYINLGVIERNLGNIIKARKYLEKALKILSRQYGPRHKTVSDCLLNLAGLCLNLKIKNCSVLESVIYSQTALSIDDSSKNKAIHYNILGNKHYLEDDVEQAKNYFLLASKSLREALDVPGADLQSIYMQFAVLFSNLGGSYHRLGNYERAKKSLNSSISMYEMLTGPHHLSLADSYFNLGLAHKELNELIDAVECFRRSREIYTKQLKPTHEKIVFASQNLAAVLRESGQLDEAALLDKQYGTCCRSI